MALLFGSYRDAARIVAFEVYVTSFDLNDHDSAVVKKDVICLKFAVFPVLSQGDEPFFRKVPRRYSLTPTPNREVELQRIPPTASRISSASNERGGTITPANVFR